MKQRKFRKIRTYRSFNGYYARTERHDKAVREAVDEWLTKHGFVGGLSGLLGPMGYLGIL